MNGLGNGTPLCVATYPAAWRVEVAKDVEYKGYEYVRSGRTLFDTPECPTDATYQFFLGNHEQNLGPRWGR